MYLDVISSLLALTLLIMLPLEILKVRKYKREIIENGRQVIESNNVRLEAMEEHKKVVKEHQEALEYFTETKNFNLRR